MKQQIDHESLLEAARLLVQVKSDNFLDCNGDAHSMSNLRHAIKLSFQGLGMSDVITQTEMETSDWKKGLIDNIDALRALVANRLVRKLKDNDSIIMSAPARDWDIDHEHDTWTLIVSMPSTENGNPRLVPLSLNFAMGQDTIVDATLDKQYLSSSVYNPSDDIHEKQMDAIVLLFNTLKSARPWRHFGYDYEIREQQIIDTWHNENNSISSRYYRDILVDVGENLMIHRMNVSFEPGSDQISHAAFGSIDITSLSNAIAEETLDLNELDKANTKTDEFAFQP